MGRIIEEIHAAMKRGEPLPVADAILYAQHHIRDAVRDEREECAAIADRLAADARLRHRAEAGRELARLIRGRAGN